MPGVQWSHPRGGRLMSLIGAAEWVCKTRVCSNQQPSPSLTHQLCLSRSPPRPLRASNSHSPTIYSSSVPPAHGPATHPLCCYGPYIFPPPPPPGARPPRPLQGARLRRRVAILQHHSLHQGGQDWRAGTMLPVTTDQIECLLVCANLTAPHTSACYL